MKQDFIISIVLDKRRALKTGLYPVRLRVFTRTTGNTGTQKLYSTAFSFSENDFTQCWIEQKQKFKDDRLKLQALENKANEVAGKITPFDIDEFERIFLNKKSLDKNVNYYFDTIIEQKTAKERISTALGYKNAFDALQRFHKSRTTNKNKTDVSINFKEITVSYLEGYQSYLTDQENKTIATVGIYLRNLRTVFNEAIKEKTISKDIYPFGANKFSIKTSGKTKRALDKEQILILFNGTPETPEQEQAKAFWFFSYLCNGMNFYDVLNLSYKKNLISDDRLSFVRKKTESTTKDIVSIDVYLHEYAKQVISEYGNKDKTGYIFSFFKNEHTAKDKKQITKNFTSNVNWYFRKYCESLGIKENVTAIWARHSYVTTMIRSEMSLQFVSESLGHTDISTTVGYFKGFSDDVRKDATNKLL